MVTFLHYCVSYFHTYLVHLGAWTTIIIGMRIKDKPLEAKNIVFLLKDAFLSAMILSMFSSFSHNHFKSFL